jgi:hypothetical protein
VLPADFRPFLPVNVANRPVLACLKIVADLASAKVLMFTFNQA